MKLIELKGYKRISLLSEEDALHLVGANRDRRRMHLYRVKKKKEKKKRKVNNKVPTGITTEEYIILLKKGLERNE